MFPFAAWTLQPLWEDRGLPLALLGMLVVFLALVLMIAFIALLPRLMLLLDRLHPEGAPAKGKQESKAKRKRDEPSEELLVVLAAAVAATIDAPHRIVHARRLTRDEQGWSLEGRMRHHASHGRQGPANR